MAAFRSAKERYFPERFLGEFTSYQIAGRPLFGISQYMDNTRRYANLLVLGDQPNQAMFENRLCGGPE